jgi:hypothetical protein
VGIAFSAALSSAPSLNGQWHHNFNLQHTKADNDDHDTHSTTLLYLVSIKCDLPADASSHPVISAVSNLQLKLELAISDKPRTMR